MVFIPQRNCTIVKTIRIENGKFPNTKSGILPSAILSLHGLDFNKRKTVFIMSKQSIKNFYD